MQDKFCVNCKHSFDIPLVSYDDHCVLYCNQFMDWQETDIVTGITRTAHRRCGTIRCNDNECGPEGKLFEPNFKYKVISIIKGVFK